MKTRVLSCIFIVICYANLSAQELWGLPLDEETSKVSYKEIIDVHGTDQATLYSRAKEWILLQNYDDPVVVLKDKEYLFFENPVVLDDGSSKIYTDGFFHIHYRSDKSDRFYIVFNLRLRTKEGKYQYEITDFILKEFIDPHSGPGGPGRPSPHSKSSSYSNVDVKIFKIEDFFNSETRRKEKNLAFPEFKFNMEALISDLKATMNSNSDW
jgi:hypothetical protein